MKNLSTNEMARELGRRGGQATLKKYGREHFRKLATLPLKDKKESDI